MTRSLCQKSSQIIDISFQYVSFPEPEASVSFSEGAVVGTRRLLEPATVQGGASDQQQISYSIVTGDWDNRFRLVHHPGSGPSSGYLHLETLKPLDRELSDQYNLNISARLGSGEGFATVKVLFL